MRCSSPRPASCTMHAIVSDLRTHGLAMFERFRAGQEGTLWYYRALGEALAQRLPGPLSRDLAGAAGMKALAAAASGRDQDRR